MADPGQALLNLLRGGSASPTPSIPQSHPPPEPQLQNVTSHGYPIHSNAPPNLYALPIPMGGTPTDTRPPMSREQSLLAILQNAPPQQQPTSFLPQSAQDTNAAFTHNLRSLLSIGPSARFGNVPDVNISSKSDQNVLVDQLSARPPTHHSRQEYHLALPQVHINPQWEIQRSSHLLAGSAPEDRIMSPTLSQITSLCKKMQSLMHSSILK